MNTFVRVFSESGSGGEHRLEVRINEVAELYNLDIISAEPCFKNGFLEDTLFIVVIYKERVDNEQRKAD